MTPREEPRSQRGPSPTTPNGVSRNLAGAGPVATPETVYLAAPLTSFGDGRYDRCLRILRLLLPGAEILDPRDLFADSRAWRKRWPSVLDRLDRLVFVADSDRTIGPGVYREIRDACDRGLPVFLLLSSTRELIPLDHVKFDPLPERAPEAVFRIGRLPEPEPMRDRIRSLDLTAEYSSGGLHRAGSTPPPPAKVEPPPPDMFDMEPEWKDKWQSSSYEESFYEEAWRKGLGGYRSHIERDERRAAELRARGLGDIPIPDHFRAWAEDYRREHGDRPALRAIERAIREGTLAGACRWEGTTVRTARRYLREYRAHVGGRAARQVAAEARQAMSAETVALAGNSRVRGKRRHHRALHELRARFPEATIVEAGSLDELPDRLVFMTEAGVIDEGVYRTIADCDEAGVRVDMLACSGRVVPRDRLQLTTYPHSSRAAFAVVKTLRDRKVNPRAFG